MISKSYVALFGKPLEKEHVTSFVASWLERFEKVEQITPNSGTDICAISVNTSDEVLWEKHLQFRVTNGEEFSWVYLTLERYVIETSSLPADEIALCLDVLLELPGVDEIIEGHNDRRLDELEAKGLM
jgi:hypothetical protein